MQIQPQSEGPGLAFRTWNIVTMHSPGPAHAADASSTLAYACLFSTAPSHRSFFTGKERDAESGNDYFDARYYASSMGRFLSPDWSAQEEPVPYAHLESLNLYSYVLNNPLAKADLDGHGCPPDCGDPTAETQAAPSSGEGRDFLTLPISGTIGMLKAGYNAFLSGNTAANRKMGIPDTPALQPANDGETAGMTAAPLVVAAGIPEIEPEAAGAAEATLLGAARDARDAMASEVGKKVATVTAGYNTETGAVAAACSGGGVCAEANVVKALGGDANKVKFTEAVRPRTGNEVPVCTSCEAQYGKKAFPPGTKFQSDQIKP